MSDMGISTLSGVTKYAVVAFMWLLGLSMLAGFAWATQWRETAAVPGDGEAAAQAASGSPLATLTAGLSGTASAALDELESGSRSEGAHALDAAIRLAEVGEANASGPLKTQYVITLAKLQTAQEALWNGDAHGARSSLGQAVAALESASATAATAAAPEPPPEPVWDGYDGAVLLAPDGEEIGEVESIGTPSDPRAQLGVGEATDVFGLVDLGEESITVPIDQVLWGPRPTMGARHAVLLSAR